MQIPAIVYLERVDVRESLDFSGLSDKINPNILSLDTSISLYVFILLLRTLANCSAEIGMRNLFSMRLSVLMNCHGQELWLLLTLNSFQCNRSISPMITFK